MTDEIAEPECPSDECLMCIGEACDLCGAGCWNNSPSQRCEHDVTERHRSAFAGVDRTTPEDPIAELSRLLCEAGLRPTFDPERSIAKPCMVCGTTERPRDLVKIGTRTRPIGGHAIGDAITRPMCASCEELTRAKPV